MLTDLLRHTVKECGIQNSQLKLDTIMSTDHDYYKSLKVQRRARMMAVLEQKTSGEVRAL